MRIVWIRHGQPAWFGDQGGIYDPELTDLGHDQARSVAQRVASWNVDEVWVSPAIRAQQTAAPLCEALGIQALTKDWMTEVKVPLLQGRSQQELAPIFAEARARPVADWWRGLEGCEPYAEFRDRVCGGLNQVLAERGAEHHDTGSARLWHGLTDERCVLAVCHAGTSAVALSHLVGLGQVPWSWMRMPLHHAGMAEARSVRVSDGHAFALCNFNDCEHLTQGNRTR